MHCVDLGESFPTSIYLQKSPSIQPRTSPSKFGGKYSILFNRVLILRARFCESAAGSFGSFGIAEAEVRMQGDRLLPEASAPASGIGKTRAIGGLPRAYLEKSPVSFSECPPRKKKAPRQRRNYRNVGHALVSVVRDDGTRAG